jgi:hypothetical protein
MLITRSSVAELAVELEGAEEMEVPVEEKSEVGLVDEEEEEEEEFEEEEDGSSVACRRSRGARDRRGGAI